jgi:hypothetical protein
VKGRFIICTLSDIIRVIRLRRIKNWEIYPKEDKFYKSLFGKTEGKDRLCDTDVN